MAYIFHETKIGTWEVHSESDPRWYGSGIRDPKRLLCEGFPDDMKEWVEQCKEKYGKPPKDITFSYY